MRLLPRDTERPPRVVLIDSDPAETTRLTASLTHRGFSVTPTYDTRTGLEAVARQRPDIVTVDAEAPFSDGFETVRRIRRFSDAVVIILTRDGDEASTIEGFRSGADDYVVKPVGPDALAARVQARLRRSQSAAPAAPARPAVWLEHGPIQLHLASRRALLHGRDRGLTRSEFDILAALMRDGDEVFSKTRLALVLRDANGMTGQHITDHDRHAVEVHVMNLRRKLGDDSREQQWIQTVRGLGYRLTPVSDPLPLSMRAGADIGPVLLGATG